MTNAHLVPGLSSLRCGRREDLLHGMIREERLRATAALRQSLPLTSWRGRSGRRYVVGMHPSGEPDLADVTDAVVLAVQRGPDGTAALVDAAVPGGRSSRDARLGWLAAARTRGATELHVHRLAESDAERQAVVADLVGSAAA